MAEESFQNANGSSVQHQQDEPAKEEAPERAPERGRRREQQGVGWTVWLLIALMVLLFGSSVANLVVSHRAYESSRKQVRAIEQLTQSIKDIQRSIVNLSNMLEQTPAEEEEPEEDRGGGPTGDGSI
jgi:ferric-dicitrate binding protein FerR (iron transport regulator)